ncbi:MAG TPA: hypothetical protein VGC65_01225 [Bacteroidia bacterium]|jgi:tetratricopeptide (TPR) repeat protein
MKTLPLLFLLCFSAVAPAQEKGADKYDKLMDSLVKRNELDLLINLLEKEVLAAPRDEGALRALAYSCLLAGKNELCETYYVRALETNPACVNCWVNIGSSYMRRNNKIKTFESYDNAIRIDPKNAHAYCLRGKMKLQFGEKVGALMDFNKAIELEPGNAGLYYERSLYNSAQGFSSMALNDMTKALELAVKDAKPIIYLRRAELYNAQDRNKEALSDLNAAILLDSSNPDFYLERGVVHADLNQNDLAYDDYIKCASLDTNSFAPLYNLALLTHNFRQDMDASCDFRHRAVAIMKRNDPTNAKIRELEALDSTFCDSSNAGYYYQRAISASLKGDHQKGLDICNANMKRFPNEALLINTRGDIFYYMKMFDKARKDYEIVIRLGPAKMMSPMMSNHPELWNMSKDSVKLFEGINTAAVLMAIAQCDFALGKTELALSEINEALGMIKFTLGESMEAMYQLRGSLFLAAGKQDSALLDFEKAISFKRSPKDLVTRAVGTVCAAGKISPQFTYPFRDKIFTPFIVHWILPLRSNLDPESPAFTAALRDCNSAIEQDPSCAYAYFIRGQILRLASIEGFCSDFEKARQLGFVVDKPVLKGCK